MIFYFVLLLVSITLLFLFYVFVDKTALPSFQTELSGILKTKENLFNRKNYTLTQNPYSVYEEGWLALEIGYFPDIFCYDKEIVSLYSSVNPICVPYVGE